MTGDTYYTIAAKSESSLTEKRSRFLAFLEPVCTAEQALEIVATYRKKYYDARHVCWAYRLGADGIERSNDDGEPSGTAGKPILGRLVSADLSDVVGIVVRYFGGIKLGTSGLIEAYRTAMAMAIEEADRLPVIRKEEMDIQFGYELMGEIMRLVKDSSAEVIEQDCRESCRLRIRIRANDSSQLKSRLSSLYGCQLSVPNEKTDSSQAE
ncbi:IMPACT family member yigZ [Porphyromonas crevioricanis]|uniref:IMPACT family member yigZ n=1 Tax=Porphyromonas crevioricanis TaxID=393921 RepID=A0A2X4PFS4_9PORP|nr:YigZ family protein [Porphyromonas crevioricanis]GAD07445.1 protein co-occurring with transport systems [Porphyromonas crevioricanis JCM 13913]SQH72684.1 IMPACT family member yigZ [Porphyromonas crevioricanis]